MSLGAGAARRASPASSRSSATTGSRRSRWRRGCPSSCRSRCRRSSRVRRLSFTALASFERCSYRYYAERLVGMKALRPAPTDGGTDGLGALDVGDAVHRLLETIDLRDPRVVDLERVREWYPRVDRGRARADRRLRRGLLRVAAGAARRGARRRAGRGAVHVRARRRPASAGSSTSCTWPATARSSSTTRRTSSARATPEEIVDQDYRLQRLVYALACFRSGAQRVEVVYHFLERPDATVSALFTRGRRAGARGGAVGGDRAHPGRRVRPDAERVRVRGLSRRSTSSAPGPRVRTAPQHLEAFAPA